MKIACVTDDGQTISQHFGRAAYYTVVTIEDDKIVEQEMRPKMGHPRAGGVEHQQAPGQRRGTDAGSHSVHVSMADAISDCEVLLCRGMGYGAYQSMQQVGITPMVTDVALINDAIQAYIDGKLEDHPEKLH